MSTTSPLTGGGALASVCAFSSPCPFPAVGGGVATTVGTVELRVGLARGGLPFFFLILAFSFYICQNPSHT